MEHRNDALPYSLAEFDDDLRREVKAHGHVRLMTDEERMRRFPGNLDDDITRRWLFAREEGE